MTRNEKRAYELMAHGDKLIAEKKRKTAIIRRTLISAAGIGTAAAIGFGLWNNTNMKNAADNDIFLSENEVIGETTDIPESVQTTDIPDKTTFKADSSTKTTAITEIVPDSSFFETVTAVSETRSPEVNSVPKLTSETVATVSAGKKTTVKTTTATIPVSKETTVKTTISTVFASKNSTVKTTVSTVSNGKITTAKTTASTASNGKITTVKTTASKVSNGKITTAKTTASKVSNGKITTAKTTASKVSNGKITTAKTTASKNNSTSSVTKASVTSVVTSKTTISYTTYMTFGTTACTTANTSALTESTISATTSSTAAVTTTTADTNHKYESGDETKDQYCFCHVNNFLGGRYEANKEFNLSEEIIGEKIGDAEADLIYHNGYKGKNESFTQNSEIFAIKGISEKFAIAVKYEGSDEYYSLRNCVYTPEDLGQFIEDCGIERYAVIKKTSYYVKHFVSPDSPEIIEHYKVDINKFLSYFSDKLDAKALTSIYGEYDICFIISMPEIGFSGLVKLTRDGFFHTNLTYFSKSYFIGIDEVSIITNDIIQNCEKIQEE